MASAILIKRSAVQAKTPATTDLALGELAINTYDGALYLKKTVLGTDTIVQIGGPASAASLTGTTLATNLVTSSLTSVGTLTSLTVAGIIKPTAMQETRVAMAANNIDLSTGNYFTKTISAVTTLTISNIPVAGTVGEFILRLTNGGSSTVTWFSNIKWVSGVAPVLTAAGTDNLGFYSDDAGASWQGFVLGLNNK